MKSVYEDIKNIFYGGNYSFTGNYQSAKDIAFLIENDYLELSELLIASKKDYMELASDPSLLELNDEAAGGGVTHVALKLLGARFLKKERKMKSKYEQQFCGYTPDVLSEDQSIVIECGHTQNSEKMFDYFSHGDLQEFIQIPYPDQNNQTIVGYSFTKKGDGLVGFLSKLSKHKLSNAKEVFKNNNTQSN